LMQVEVKHSVFTSSPVKNTNFHTNAQILHSRSILSNYKL